MKNKHQKNKLLLIPYRRDNKWGYCDKNLRIKIPIIYDEALPFTEGLAAVRVAIHWGFINKKGCPITEFIYHSATKFERGKASVISTDLRKYLIINKKGQVVSSYDLKIEDSSDKFQELVPKNIHTKYVYTSEYGDRVIYVSDKNGKVTRIDYPEPNSTQDSYWELLADFKFDLKYLHINNEGKKVISDSPDGFYDSEGNFINGYQSEVKILKKEFSYSPEPFIEGFAPVKIGRKWNFINESLHILFDAKAKYSDFLEQFPFDEIWDGFDEVRNFSEGLAAVKVKGEWGFINTTGKVIIKCKYDDISDSEYYVFKDGIAKIRDNSLVTRLINLDHLDSNQLPSKIEVTDNLYPFANISNGYDYIFIDKDEKRYFDFFEDVLKRELSLTQFEIDYLDEKFPIFSQLINFLKHKEYKKLKSLINEQIKKNRTKFRYDQTTLSILGKLKKQTKILIKLFQLSDIKSEAWQKIIFALVQLLVKKKNEYYDSRYTEYYSNDYQKFFNNLKADFTTEILINEMIGYYERNRLRKLFHLCNALNDGKDIQIKIKGLRSIATVLNKFSLEISTERIKELLRYFSEIGLDNNKGKNKKGLETASYSINKIDRIEVNNTFYKLKSLHELLIKQPEFFIKYISLNYPFNKTELTRWQEHLDWNSVSYNTNIKFNVKLLNLFNQKWFWYELSNNKSIHWNKELLNACMSLLYRPDHLLGNPMSSISNSKSIVWSVELIEEFTDKWDWKCLSSNNNLPWDEKLVKRFSSQWDWNSLCIRGKFWTEDLIAVLKDELDKNEEYWNYLLSNKNIKWSMELLNKYKDKWFKKLPFRRYKEYDVYDNEKLPWGEDFIERFKDKFNWYKLSESKILPWSENLISHFSDYWVWEVLGSNESIPWDHKLMIKFEKKPFLKETYFGSIFTNPSVKWSEDFIDKYADKINWKDLSSNYAMNWTSELIDKYCDKIDWRNLSANERILWTDELINQYSSKLDFHSLSNNKSFNWTYELIDKFKDKIDWYAFSGVNKNWSEEVINDFNQYFRWDVLVNNEHFPWKLSLIKRFCSQMIDKIDIFKYQVFNSTAIPISEDYYNFIMELYPDFKIDYSFEDISYFILSRKEVVRRFYEISKVIDPILNKFSINILILLLNQNKLLPHFPSELEETESRQESELDMKRQQWEDNYMSKEDLADFLGYDGKDIDNISEDDIWERTGH